MKAMDTYSGKQEIQLYTEKKKHVWPYWILLFSITTSLGFFVVWLFHHFGLFLNW